MKDYYRILEVPARAQLPDIKKAYRRLALQYHPDKNTSPFAAARFHELHEAYNTLSNPDKRRRYDEERWLSGMGNRMHEHIITAEWIWHEAAKLHKHVTQVDTYRMSHGALRDYILLLLSDAHTAVLLQHADDTLNHKIINEILLSTVKLKASYQQEVMARLVQIANGNEELITDINTILQRRIKAEQNKTMLPYMVIAITILLCLFMYLYGR